MMKAIFHVILFAGALLGQNVQAGHPNALKGAVSVTVLPWSPPADPVSVRITRVELANDSFRLEIENDASDAVVAVSIGYPFSGCFVGHAGISSADAVRFAGMDSVDIPAHGRVWYTDEDMASRLADAAIMNKTRYVQARVGIGSAVFASGKTVQFGPKGKNLAENKPTAAVSADTCEKWPWEEVLDGVHAFQPPPDTTANKVSGNHREPGVSYTCSLLDDTLHCPD